ncbi:response regulator PleD [bacterium BMS3Abin14]|nr:response regulator PleD [bacterium BMS3Abin14]
MDTVGKTPIVRGGGAAAYLRVFTESLGIHLLLAGPDGKPVGRVEGLRGLCGWMCAADRKPCVDVCKKPKSGFYPDDVIRINRCPLGLTVFVMPIIYRKELMGYLRGGGVLPRDGFVPEVSVLVGAGMDRSDACAAAAMTAKNSFRPVSELSALLGGVKKSLQVFAGTLRLKSAADRRIRQIEALFGFLEGLRAELPRKDVGGIFVNALNILFGVDSVFVAVPRPLGEGLFLLAASGDVTLLPEEVGSNVGERFSRIFHNIAEPYLIEDMVALLDAGFPEGVCSAWFIPVGAGERMSGLLVLLNSSLSSADVRLIKGFAGVLAQAFHVFNLERQAESLMDERAFLLSLVRELLGAVEEDDVYEILLSKACSITGAEKGSIMFRDDDGKLAVRKTFGPDEEVLRGYRICPGEGIAGKVLATGTPMCVEDVAVDLRGKPKRTRYRTGSFISLPLFPGSHPPGVLNLSDKVSGAPFTRVDMDRVRAISDHALLAVERAYYINRWKDVSSQASTDALTGLANRMHLMENLGREMERCRRHGRALSVIMADVDRFKEYNDHNGHLAGDDALKVIASVMKRSVRNIDIACRFGGEEFCLVLPDVDTPGAMIIAERIRDEVARTCFPGEERMASSVLTLSLGVAGFHGFAKSAEGLIHSADIALYRAKRDGRNLVRSAELLGDSPTACVSGQGAFQDGRGTNHA